MTSDADPSTTGPSTKDPPPVGSSTLDTTPPRSLLVAASYVVLRRGDQVLLQLRRGTGYLDEHWAVLAGHVDSGESVVEAAAREALEESGVVIALEDLRPLATMHRYQGGGPQVEQRADFFFEAWAWRGEPQIIEPDKCADMRWFPLAALPEPVVPHERIVLDGLTGPDGTTAIMVVRS